MYISRDVDFSRRWPIFDLSCEENADRRYWNWVVGHPIDSGIGLSITIDKIRVFISVSLGKVWGHVSIQTTIYMLVGVSENDKCVSVTQW